MNIQHQSIAIFGAQTRRTLLALLCLAATCATPAMAQIAGAGAEYSIVDRAATERESAEYSIVDRAVHDRTYNEKIMQRVLENQGLRDDPLGNALLGALGYGIIQGIMQGAKGGVAEGFKEVRDSLVIDEGIRQGEMYYDEHGRQRHINQDYDDNETVRMNSIP